LKKAKGDYRVCQPDTHEKFEAAVVRFGHKIVLLYSLLAHNDYSSISGVGTSMAIKIATEAGTAAAGGYVLAHTAALVRRRVHPTPPRNWLSEHDVLKMLETGLIMFRHALVFDPTTNNIRPLRFLHFWCCIYSLLRCHAPLEYSFCPKYLCVVSVLG
jgi:hypothetical protein